ncbi:MAG: ribonuclease P protein component [bacterium]
MNAVTDSGTSKPAAGPFRGLPRSQRITRSGQFSEAYDRGRCFRGRLLTMWLSAGPDAALRLGVVTGRRVGEAVARVRARRLMREAFRLNRSRFRGGVDVVLSARSDICRAGMHDVEAELLALAKKAGILR